MADHIVLGYAFDTSLRGPPEFLQGVLGMPADAELPDGYPICDSLEFGPCPSRDGKQQSHTILMTEAAR